MSGAKTTKDGFSRLGLGAAACVACCAGSILAFLGGISVAGLVSTWLIGGAGLLIAAAAAAAVAFVLVRHRRQQSACAVAPDGPVPVELTGRARQS